MSGVDHARRLVFTGKQAVHIEDFQLPEPGESEVRVKTYISLMSTGTENIVFNRLFDPGTHWDDWVKYPFLPGYTSVGEVIETGPGVTNLKPGDRVAYRTSHSSHAVASAIGGCHAIPDGLPFDQAVWFALAKIAFHGVWSAGLGLGSDVLAIGAGPIGQMALRWARAAGASKIIVVDFAAQRLALAAAGGATACIAEPVNEARAAVETANGGRAVGAVIDSTGNAKVFASALGMVADYGKVIVLGDTGAPAQQALTSDVIRRGLHVVGAHDGNQVPGWPAARIIELFFHLAATKRFPLEGMNTHFFAPEDCAEAYATANRERATTMGIVFSWADIRS